MLVPFVRAEATAHPIPVACLAQAGEEIGCQSMRSDDLPDFTEMTRREIEDYLVERAMVESEFRKALLEKPEQLLRELGLPVGDDVVIRVFEEERKSFYLVLPRMLRELEDLDDTELDEISGGQSGTYRFFKGYA